PRFEQKGSAFFLQKIGKRAILIFLIGLFLNWTPFVQWHDGYLIVKNFQQVRIMGVLQRIALSYFLAALIIYYAKPRGAFVIGCIILLLYWVLTLLAGAPGDPYSLQGFWGTSFDIHLFGINHVYKGEGVPFDPEGLSSTPGAIVQVIIGYLTGQYIQQKGKTFEMLANLLVMALVLMAVGYIWDMQFPINKKIWSSSYVVYTSGLAMATLGILIYAIEFKEKRGAWSRFFDVFGKNPLFIFVLSGFLPRVLGLIRIPHGTNEEGLPVYLSPFGWLYEYICKPISTDQRIGSLVYALILIAFYWLIVYSMDKKKIYIKV
ncbi:MAG: DUF5009 domain-containing protein, partial [Bacteroidota bacterium]|nr:DUF5009 domain-containing protein [Bacteroidota bacterium]